MSLTPLTSPVHAPDEYVKLYAGLMISLSEEAGMLNELRDSYEAAPVGKTMSAPRLALLRSILASHQERAGLIQKLTDAEFELFEGKREVAK
ncbi:MAG: hypothetical protein AB7U82_27795 [Blastocatellales bacterium]